MKYEFSDERRLGKGNKFIAFINECIFMMTIIYNFFFYALSLEPHSFQEFRKLDRSTLLIQEGYSRGVFFLEFEENSFLP